MRVPPTLLATTVLLMTTVAACTGGEETASAPMIDVSPTTAATVGTITEDPASDATMTPTGNNAAPPPGSPPFNADTRPDTGEAAGPGPTSVAEVDVAAHQGFDRVVFRIVGDGVAGWDVRYVDAARSQGSGAPVEVAGAAVLQVSLTNIAYPHDFDGTSYVGPGRIQAHATAAVREIVNGTIYEGQHVFFVGTVGELPFRVFRLEGPQRMVLDIQHPQ